MRAWNLCRAVPAVAVLVTLLTVLAGCDIGSGTSAPPSAASSAGSSAGSSASSGTAGGASGIAGVVTAEQAGEALVTADDMPDGWSQDDTSDSGERRTTYDPRACSALSAPVQQSSVLARASYSVTGQFAANLTEQIYVPAGATPKARVAELKALLSTCASYKVTTMSGTSTIKVSALPFPTLGEATLAVRTEANGALIPVVDDAIYIAAGGQIVRFDSISTGTGLADKDLQKLARLSYERLQEVS